MGHYASRRLYHTRRLVLGALLGAWMICVKEVLAALPNVEAVSLLVIVYTAVYRWYALVPIYVFVAVEAVLYPYPATVIMYLYVWVILFGAVMLLPRGRVLPAAVYAGISGLYGLCFGILCAPVQAIWFALTPEGTWSWILAGLPFDVIHGIGNAVIALLAPALIRLLCRLEAKM